MTEIPIKTRQRILRKARMFLAQGQADYMCQAIYWSYPRFFENYEPSEAIKLFPEVYKRKPKELGFAAMWFHGAHARQERINLLSDAIKELNQKIKAEAANSSGVAQGNRRFAGRKGSLYNANQW